MLTKQQCRSTSVPLDFHWFIKGTNIISMLRNMHTVLLLHLETETIQSFTSMILFFLKFQSRLTVDLGGRCCASAGMFLSSNSTSFMWLRNRCLGVSVFSALIARMDSVDPNNGGLCGLFEYLFWGNNETIID